MYGIIILKRRQKSKRSKYWNKLKQRLKEEGNETVTNCHQLKLRAQDGGLIAKNTRKQIEAKTGKKVVTSKNNKYLKQIN